MSRLVFEMRIARSCKRIRTWVNGKLALIVLRLDHSEEQVRLTVPRERTFRRRRSAIARPERLTDGNLRSLRASRGLELSFVKTWQLNRAQVRNAKRRCSLQALD